MNDDELRSAYAALRRARAQRPVWEQPTPEAMRTALDGELSESERERILEQAITSGASAQLALLQAAHVASSGALPNTTSRASMTRGTTRSTRRWWPLAAAAALVLAVGVPLATRAPTDEAIRFRAGAVSAAPQLIAPASGAVLSDAQRFVWSAVPGSTSYTLELLDANGRSVTQLVVNDTTAVLGPSVTEVDRTRTTGWWVTVATVDGRRTRSELRLTRQR
ncbi:hypothetical protein [Gemmatimonas sp.]|uniref:hypothetical protein n=1 Tax=Gemmatimonas sp. TaxID=1962908 RepID=UPI002869F789|nr:hypothetical protein [Gemmatimonas sp.]